jgi:DNA recombination protein Rad52
MDWDKATPLLQAKLDPANVKPAPKGKFGSYVDGYHVVNEANRIFGEGNWSYEITRLQMVSEQTVSLKGGNGPYEQYRVGYLCCVKVCVGGTSYKEGAAVGSGVGSPLSMADHHESAVKEAETDALKRALRTYGNTFGLALYDKTQANVGVDLPPFDSAGFTERMLKSIDGARAMQDLQGYFTEAHGQKERLTPKQYADLVAAKDERKAALAAPTEDKPAEDGHVYG